MDGRAVAIAARARAASAGRALLRFGRWLWTDAVLPLARGVRRRERPALVMAAALLLALLLLLTGIVVLALRDDTPPPGQGWVDPVDGDFRYGTPFWKPGKAWKWKGHHTGVDYEAASGTRVVAAGPGRITVKGPGGAYGKHVEIDHGTVDGQRIVTLYAHLSSYAAVSVGQQVEAGTLIGHVGNTGNSFGPHLHFEVRVNWQGGVNNSEFADGWKWVDAHRARGGRIGAQVGVPTPEPTASGAATSSAGPRIDVA